MALIAAWTNFLGANFKTHHKRLLDGYGPSVVNFWPGFGDMRPASAASFVRAVSGASATNFYSIYRMNRASISDTADWLWWENQDVDVVRSLVPTDTTDEIFFTGEGAPKRTNTTIVVPGLQSPSVNHPLGIPAPATQFNAAINAAGTGPSETRTYIDTFYDSTRLREGAPNSNPRTISVPGGSTVNLSSFAAVPGGYGDVATRRIYVSVSGSEYLLCVSGAATTGTLTDDGVTRTTVLQSGGDVRKPAWLEPLSTMTGLIGLWNGMVGGFRGKELMVCEPYKPWAWPAEYRILLHHDIIGTGVWGQNWVVLTTAGPVIVRGSSPLNLNPETLAFDLSAVFKRSIVSMLDGVAWSSKNGVCFIGDGAPPDLVSKQLISPQGWRALDLSDAAFWPVATRYEDRAIFLSATGSLEINPRTREGFIRRTESARGSFYDALSDRLYLADARGGVGTGIYRWEGGSAAVAEFTTKTVRASRPTNPGYMLIIADNNSISAGGGGVLLYGDNTLRTVVTQANVVKALPGGYKAQDFRVLILSNSPVQGVLIAEDAADLAV